MNIKKTSICHFFFFIAPFFVCTIVFKNLSLILLLLSLCLAFLYLYNSKRIKVDYYFKIFQYLYFIPIIFSLIVSYFALLEYNNSNFEEYFSKNMPFRIINLCIFWFIFTVLYSIIYNQANYKKIITNYAICILIIFGLWGTWEIISIIFGLPSIDLGTRTNIHSISNISYLSNFRRITSFADEPSFLAPFLIDGIIIFAFTKKKILALPLILILIFSLSFGGYVNIFILFVYYIFLNRKHIQSKYIYYTIFSLLLLIFILGDFLYPLFEIILSRGELSSGYQASDTTRTLIIYLVWKYIFESSFICILFGHGPSSFKYLGLNETLYDGSPFHTTSNNLFVDIAYEGGLFSMFCIIFFFIRIYYIFNKLETKNNYRIIFLSKIFIVHLILSSMYRGDYVSPRFFIIILILGLLYRRAKNYDFNNNTNVPTQ